MLLHPSQPPGLIREVPPAEPLRLRLNDASAELGLSGASSSLRGQPCAPEWSIQAGFRRGGIGMAGPPQSLHQNGDVPFWTAWRGSTPGARRSAEGPRGCQREAGCWSGGGDEGSVYQQQQDVC
eukprot:s424_g13.t1